LLGWTSSFNKRPQFEQAYPELKTVPQRGHGKRVTRNAAQAHNAIQTRRTGTIEATASKSNRSFKNMATTTASGNPSTRPSTAAQ
jgi:hypothetical protein